MIYRFAQFALDTQRYELRRDGADVAVEPQVFEVLHHLIRNRDRVVSKDDLIDAVWHGRIVSDASLSSRIKSARDAVGDNGEAQAIIRTVPRRGFRFVAPVEEETASALATPETRSTGVRQEIRYCATADDVNLAYAFAGTGPTLIKVANWVNHLEYDWESPIWAPLIEEFAGYRRLLRYDTRGVGLSDWNIERITFELLVADLEAVIAASGVETFALLGISQGAAVAIDYAVRNPERVTHLILWGGFARGRRRRGLAEDAAESEAFLTLMRQGWGKERSPFRDMFAALYMPDGEDEPIRWWTELQRNATSPENAVRLREAIDDLDVSDLLARVRTPALILHSERELVAPLSEARYLAARIPGARFVPLDSANHLVLRQEPAWQRAVGEIKSFLGG